MEQVAFSPTIRLLIIALDKYINLVEDKLEEYNIGKEPSGLYEPIRYILALGGKRLRPVLTLMTYQMFDDNYENAIYPALGLEVFHNFTLLHDDIMDNAPIRRGQKTVHEKWDANTAILSGDVMLVGAYQLFLKNHRGDLHTILSKFTECAKDVCEGQRYDMNFESLDNVAESEYLNMIHLKTAVLLGFSMELGALLAGADDAICRELYEFGINVGLGFQLKDDLLDAYAENAKFGKQIGGDIISNKKTYLLIKAKELANGQVKTDLDYWLGQKQFDPTEKINAVIDIYNKLGIKELSEQKMNHYFDKGLALLDALEIDSQKKIPLHSLVLKLINREN